MSPQNSNVSNLWQCSLKHIYLNLPVRGVVSSVVKLAEVQIRGSFLYFASQADREGGREEGTTGGGY